MSLLKPLSERDGVPAGTAGGRPAGPNGSWWQHHPLAFWSAVSVVLGALSCAIWNPVPGFDVYSWIVWGRSASDPHMVFYISGGPSWKPLPVLFTSFYGLFGQAAPTLWVITARAGGILGLLGIFRLSLELTDRAQLPRWSGWVAGVVGCVGLIMTAPNIDANWTHNFFRGTAEPVMIAAWLWAIDAMLRRRHLLAYTLVAAEGLIRPEAWLFLFAYGVWLWFAHPRLRVWVVLGLLAQPVGWFAPPGISTGHPFMAATNAHSYNGQLGGNWLKTILDRAYTLQPLPTLVFAAIATVTALWRQRQRLAIWRTEDRMAVWAGRDSLTLSLAVLSCAWWLVVIVETGAGYPGLQRFFFPAAATACVLSGLGFVEVAACAGRSAARLLDAGRRAGAVMITGRTTVLASIGAVAVLGVVSYPFITSRLAYARIQKSQVGVERRQLHDLSAAITALGGTKALLPCASSAVTINSTYQPEMAWEMAVDLTRVKSRLVEPGVAFITRTTSYDGPLHRFGPGLHRRRLLGRWGAWRVYQVYGAGPKPRCVGR